MGTEKIIIDVKGEEVETKKKVDFESIKETDIIKLETKPVIDYKNIRIMGEIVSQHLESLNLNNIVITEDNVAEVKRTRAAIRKQFHALEDVRKNIRREIEKPYKEFLPVYNEEIRDRYKEYDEYLKSEIDKFEDQLREEKRERIKQYFIELGTSKGINFVDFEEANINVTLSASEASLRKEVDEFYELIERDLAVINIHDHKNRLFAKYVKTLDLQGSLVELAEELRIEEQALENLEEVKEVKKEEEKEEVVVPEVNKVEPLLKASFSVIGTKDQIVKIRDYIRELGIEYTVE